MQTEIFNLFNITFFLAYMLTMFVVFYALGLGIAKSRFKEALWLSIISGLLLVVLLVTQGPVR